MAVDVEYDEFSGDWWLAQTDEFNRAQSLLKPHETELESTRGTADVIRRLMAGKGGRSVLIGDGTSDLAASETVDLFVGYTGVVARDRILENAPLVLTSRSLAPLIVVAGGVEVDHRLDQSGYATLCRKAYDLIDEHALSFNDTAVQSSFVDAYDAARRDADTIF